LKRGLVVPDHLKDDPEVQRALAELDATFEANPLEAYNNPLLPKVHKKQLEFHAATTKIKMFKAGNRSGKTVACVVDDLIQAIDERALPEHLKQYKKWQPPFKCWIGAPKFDKHQDTILPLIRQFCPKSQFVGDSFDKAFAKQDRILRFKNGSTFGFKTYDQDVDAWASAEIHRVHWDEEPEGEHGYTIRSEGRARLVSTDGDEILGMTPLFGLSWVYDKVWLRRHEPHITVVNATIHDNPWNSEAAIKEFLAELTPQEREARELGEFVHFAGLVYPELSDDHFVENRPPEFLRSQTVYLGIDPGIRTTAVVFVAFDNDNCAYVFDELYLHDENAIPANASKAIESKLGYWGVKPRHVLIDPSARNRSLVDADRVQAAYHRAGIKAFPAQNDVEAGVFEVKRRLEFKQLLISERCEKLRWELSRYRIDPKENGTFAVVKQDDHAADALRYALMARPLAPHKAPRNTRRPERWVQETAPPMDYSPRPEAPPLGAFA
jgi:phage terminase large subunit-like protein